MKILSVAWAINDSRLREFTHNVTGAGIVIRNLAEELGKNIDSYLFVGKYILPETKLGHITLVKTDYEFERSGIDDLSENEIHLQRMTRAFIRALETIKPDVVNFHSSGDLTLRCMKVCIEKSVSYVFTEHLFIELDQTYGSYERYVEWEKSILKTPDLKIIAVSTGVKKKILQAFPSLLQTNIKVIPNGTDFEKIPEDIVLKSRYCTENTKVLLCVGTIMVRKNQRQIVKAFQLLPEAVKNTLKIVFCGKDTMKGALQNDIAEAGLEDCLICVGAIDSNEMKKYYSIADGLIMPSLAEGLSIASLEAISCGLPIIIFSDSEYADDLSDNRVVCFAQERTDFGLAKAIEDWYDREWDRDYIIDYAKFFTLERMANDYIEYYKEICGK